MNLPQCINDRSVLKHEPLRTHITLYQQCSRLERKKVISEFVKAMKKDHRAISASKQWAYFVFADYDLSRDRFKVTDNEEMLYKTFLKYHVKLSGGSTVDLERYRSHLIRNGIGTVKPEELRPNARRSEGSKGRREGQRDQRSACQYPQRVSGPKKDRLQAEADDHHSYQAVSASRSTANSVGETQLGPVSGDDAQPSRLSADAKPNHLGSKRDKKRKPSSQKPPVITSSDASEGEKKSSETQEVAARSSVSHRLKRVALNPPPHKLRVVKDLASKKTSAPQLKTKHRVGVSSPPTIFTSGNSVLGLQVARRSAGRPLSRHQRSNARPPDISKRPKRASSKSARLRKKKSTGDLPTRPNKRLRGASRPVMDIGREGEFESISARFIAEPIIEKAVVTGLPSSLKKARVKKAKASKKRTRPEYEFSSATTSEDTQVDYSEYLGPDVRPSRPLPRKVRNERAVPPLNEDATMRGIPGGGPSLRDADQLLRDSASNALALLREGSIPDVPDWTQDEEQDADCDVPEDQDETNDAQSTAAASVASVGAGKPPVPAPPRIWAQSRQEVCESFEHFRSYHSGVYSKDDIVKGYLLGAYAANRDVFHHGGRLIISHGGGKSEAILGAKRFQTDLDQESSDKSVRALLNTWKDRRPVVLLADDKYALFPYDLASGNYTYVVLGLYWISHAWAECQASRDGSGRIVRWKFAFQWCEGQGDPWWTPQQDMDMTPQSSALISNPRMRLTNGPPHPANSGENPNIECERCHEQSPSVYQQGWICLNPRCERFWVLNDEEPKQLDYRDEFLSLLPQKFDMLPNIIPAKLVVTPNGVTTTFACSKGWHCVKCGRLSCRFKWEHWECSNCEVKHEVKGRVRSPKEFWHQRPPKEFLHSRVREESGILQSFLELINLGDKKGFTNRLTFILPHGRGKIHLILGTPFSNEDADRIFELYQQQASDGDLKLRRYPLRNHRARGLLLTNYFSQNSGEPYQYVGGTGNTVPFDQAPECVRQALAVIKERARLALHADVPFNEILSAAYMERQKMSFHSDSEKGLGPVVASLSLGSAALMHFRPLVNAGEPKVRSPNALTLVLRHGDVLIMDGEGVQKYYEHTVVPMNFRIAATARCIGST